MRWIGPLAYVSAISDVADGVSRNIENNTRERIVPDMVVDAVVSGASIYGAGKIGSAAGFAFVGGKAGAIAGSVVPVAGNIVGMCVGVLAALAFYFLSDRQFEFLGDRSFREFSKDVVNSVVQGIGNLLKVCRTSAW